MTQEIITYIILAYSFGIAIYKGIGFFSIFGSKTPNPCNSCSGGSCALKSH